MTGPTHRRFSVCFALLGGVYLDITSINYYIVLVILVTFSYFGALMSDWDHAWVNISRKTVFSKVINMLVRATKGKHRSWLTHSWDITLVFTYLSCVVPSIAYDYGYISIVDKEVVTVILVGFSLGWISHLFSDMLSSSGVRLVCWSKFKVRLVPKKIFKLRFNTGNEWESFVYRMQKSINYMIGLYAIIYPYIGYIVNKINLIRGI